MQDMLPAVQSDGGVIECLPVVVFNPDGSPATGPLIPLGYVQLAVPSTSVTAVTGVPTGATIALVKVEGAAIRYTDFAIGPDPTTTFGMPLAIGETLYYDATMAAIRLIGQASGAICNIAFYGVAHA